MERHTQKQWYIGQQYMDNTIRKRRLQWLGHVFIMNYQQNTEASFAVGWFKTLRGEQVDREQTGIVRWEET